MAEFYKMNPFNGNGSRISKLFSWNKTQTKDLIVTSQTFFNSASVGRRCHFCHLRQNQRVGTKTKLGLNLAVRKRTPFYSIQTVLSPLSSSSSSFSSVAKETRTLEVSENACPQGVQGDIKGDCTFNLWLENCRRYGLENCDQQLQGIQTGRKTIAEVMAEQDSLIAEIAAEYRRQNAERRQVSFEGASQDMNVNRLPDINTPCPQGVQGEDCARFKLWLENCHKFQFGNCQDQLANYQKGRITLSQLFEEQYTMIREAAHAASNKRGVNQSSLKDSQEDTAKQTANETTVNASEQQESSKPLTSAQKLRNAVAIYGSTVMVFHISISLMSLGFFYTLVSSGIDVVGILGRLGIGETILQSKLATGTGTFVVAYAVHKVFAPARIAVTLTSTPLIVRYLRRIGFLKTPPPKK